MNNSQAEKNYGFGLGLRTAHYSDFQAKKHNVDWLEIISDNFLVAGGKPLYYLEKFRQEYPIAMHGVAMSIGSSEGLDFNYLRKIKYLAKWLEPMWVSDHLCWGGILKQPMHDLYPLPYTEECAKLIIAHINTAQDYLERKLVIENVSSYLRYRASSVNEWEFLAYIANESDCDLLVDVNNIYVSSVNHGFAPQDYLDAIPVARVKQIHLAGHSYSDDFIIDTHDHPIIPAVWDLYAQACQRFGQVATMIERDDHIPPLAELISELNQARQIAKDNCPENFTSETAQLKPINIHPITFSADYPDCLNTIQQHVFAYILAPQGRQEVVSEVATNEAPDSPHDKSSGDSKKIDGARGLAIYHNAYRMRLQDVLRDCYGKLTAYVDMEYWDLLLSEYVENYPPPSRQLGDYGAQMGKFLAAKDEKHHILAELATLEWAMRRTFDAEDCPTWSLATIENQGAEQCFSQFPILVPTATWLQFSSNVNEIWQAIHDYAEVPEVDNLPSYTVLVWRKDFRPHFRVLTEREGQFLQTLQYQSIQASVDNYLARDLFADPSELGQWLCSWWEQGLLANYQQ